MIVLWWWIIWTVFGQDSVTSSHWLSFLVLAAAFDLILAKSAD